MSQRIEQCFASLLAKDKKGLIPYIAAGDPHPALTVPLMHAMVRGGANLLELGVPFSDPMADGPVIQRASERAIKHGVGLSKTLDLVQAFRTDDKDTPVVLMGYANPIERMGITRFVREAARAGVDGVLVVDYPPEESIDFAHLLRQHGMHAIFLVSPTSTPERLDLIAKIASGYIYYVSLTGTTGAGHLDVANIAEHLPAIRERFHLPLGVGFGIRDPQSAVAVAAMTDAVVIGSRMIAELEAHPGDAGIDALERLVRTFRQALDA